MCCYISLAAFDCLLPEDNNRDTPFSIIDASPSLPNGTEAIIASYTFHCYGNITAWHTYLKPDDSQPHTMRFQVWRPSSSVAVDGCYAIVGESAFTNVVAEQDGLVSKWLDPEDMIGVSPGDVVGYYSQTDASGADSANDTGVRLDRSYTEERVWYHVNTEEDPLMTAGLVTCLFPTGTQSNRILRSFTSAAPVISIDMGMWSHACVMHACMHTSHACQYAYATCMSVCMHVFSIDAHMHVHACMHPSIQVYATCMSVCTHVFSIDAHVHVHACIHVISIDIIMHACSIIGISGLVYKHHHPMDIHTILQIFLFFLQCPCRVSPPCQHQHRPTQVNINTHTIQLIF